MKSNYFGNQYRSAKIIKLKKWIGLQTRRTLSYSAVLSLIGWSAVAGYYAHPDHVYASNSVIRVVATSTPPVMQRIAQCESGGQQYKNGQVILHVNNDKSVDIGEYQINIQTWGKTATGMKYDLTKQADNEAFALWLYQNKGTGSWYSSQDCWDK